MKRKRPTFVTDLPMYLQNTILSHLQPENQVKLSAVSRSAKNMINRYKPSGLSNTYPILPPPPTAQVTELHKRVKLAKGCAALLPFLKRGLQMVNRRTMSKSYFSRLLKKRFKDRCNASGLQHSIEYDEKYDTPYWNRTRNECWVTITLHPTTVFPYRMILELYSNTDDVVEPGDFIGLTLRFYRPHCDLYMYGHHDALPYHVNNNTTSRNWNILIPCLYIYTNPGLQTHSNRASPSFNFKRVLYDIANLGLLLKTYAQRYGLTLSTFYLFTADSQKPAIKSFLRRSAGLTDVEISD
jgi:hypothetical protein